MPHFLIEKNSIKNDLIIVENKELCAHLLHSLRIKAGEIVKFIEDETVYFSEILEISKNKIRAKILKSEKSERKLNFELCALICALKPEAMHLAIENAVQMGAKEIYTVYSDNSAINRASVQNKAEKWQKIGMESFKQCERADLPRVFDISTFEDIFSKFEPQNIIIFAEKYENCTIKEALKNTLQNKKILTVFGPEGGFSENEFNYFKQKGLKLATLGKLILKAPNAVTAGLFGVTQCMMN